MKQNTAGDFKPSESIQDDNYTNLYEIVYDLYHEEENKSKLLFHGWHHIKFVHDKTIEFAKELSANLKIAASAALVHDLNYIFSDKLEPEAAKAQVKEYLQRAQFSEEEINTIIQIIENAHLGYRGSRELSIEAKALADADTLFKALPTTPILFASRFITQNKYDVEKLAHKVVDEQESLIEQDTYFYTDIAKKKYMQWAITNLQMWKGVLESLKEDSIRELLRNAEDLGVL